MKKLITSVVAAAALATAPSLHAASGNNAGSGSKESMNNAQGNGWAIGAGVFAVIVAGGAVALGFTLKTGHS